ncbi:hypothetical protein ACFYOT_25840 [Saccharothrix saharensis]|uniref:hypothetical protein n=1 Tax=Saccharothrix saharensis TaxID=571190 RepID=UPI0036B4BD4A
MSQDTPHGAVYNDPNAVLRAFAANRAFRAAEWSELTTEDNPYRRPVRPDDLAWLDYSRPMPVEKSLRLSNLLGHRMLRNVYDLDALFLTPKPSEAVEADRQAFYNDDNRMLSAMAKPILERHLFTFLEDERDELPSTTLDAVDRYVAEHLQQRTAEPGSAFATVTATKGRKEATNFLLLQISAFRPAVHTAITRAGLGEYDLAHPRLRQLLTDQHTAWVDATPTYAAMLKSAGLEPAAAAYWQLYLGSSLARGNYMHHLAINREHFFAFLGALVHKLVDETATRDRLVEVLEDGLGADTTHLRTLPQLTGTDLSTLVHELLAPLVERFGQGVLTDFHRGFADAAWLARQWDEDLATQVAWADRIEEYQEKAEKIQRHLVDEEIDVDLDTFVESEEETSTTHVHDEHRLVIIEAGQMHFWNNTTHRIELNEGDKLLIPVSRLHGSTVLSGECTYHQPIIPEDMFQRFA